MKINRQKAIQTRWAFTLVELLVVIAVILVLITLLLPSLQGFTERAYRIMCMSNLRQLQHGFILYAGDNGGHLPTSNWRSCDGSPTSPGWAYNQGLSFTGNPSVDLPKGSIWPYVTNINVYRCPMHGGPYGCEAESICSYVCTGLLVNNGGNCSHHYRLPQFRGNEVCLWEGGGTYDSDFYSICAGNDLSQAPNEGVTYRHGYGKGAGANISCFDGHVEWWMVGEYEAQAALSPNRLWWQVH